MKKIILLALATSVVLLVGCTEEVKSERWYKEHPKETYQVYKKCLDTGEHSENCQNARRGAITFAQLGDDETKALFDPLMKR